MKHLFIVICMGMLLFTACKSDKKPAVVKATYPEIWTEKQVPAFTDGIISNDKFDNSERKIEHTVWLETEKSFEDIYNWHKTAFAQEGWKKVKDSRKNIGEDTESILMVHTKGSVKHNVIVLKQTINTNQVKTILSYFN